MRCARLPRKDRPVRPRRNPDEDSEFSPWESKKDNTWLTDTPMRSDQRITFSPYPIHKFLDKRNRLQTSGKPTGLWYACGDEWLDFLRYDMPTWMDDVNYVYEVMIGPKERWGSRGSAPVLQIKTMGEIRAFTAQYGECEKDRWSPSQVRCWDIRWQDVADDFPGGIDICPYLSDARSLGYTSWYYGWDVASGCLWGPTGFRGLRLLSKRPGSE
jgi:hypothetical protein